MAIHGSNGVVKGKVWLENLLLNKKGETMGLRNGHLANTCSNYLRRLR
jgi:hypothetical protein